MSENKLLAYEAERSVIGAILLNNDALEAVLAGGLVAADFYAANMRLIFEAFQRLADNNVKLDLVTLQEELIRAGQLEAAGGFRGIAALADDVPAAANVLHYANIVQERAHARRLYLAAHEAERTLKDGGKAQDTSDALIQALEEVAGRRTSTGLELMPDVVRGWHRETKKEAADTRVGTGFSDLDRHLSGGPRKGTLTLLAGRPGEGKSALALNVAVYAARHSRGVAFFALEMTAAEMCGRMIAARSQINQNIIEVKAREPNWPDIRRVAVAMSEISALPIAIDETPGMTLQEVSAKSKRFKLKHDLALIIVDHLQLMAVPKMSGRSRNDEIGTLSSGLKRLAKELKVAVIAVSQLNRKSIHEAPNLSHLRDSGNLEQDADNILYLWHNPKEDNKNFQELHILKQRGGRADVWIDLDFQRDIQRFNLTTRERCDESRVDTRRSANYAGNY